MPDDDPSSREAPEPSPSTAAERNPSEAPAAAAPAAEARETGAYEAFHQRARLAEDRLAEVLAAYRQLKHDNEGHRERITRSLEQRYGQQRERLLLKFIEILDNLDRALEAAERTYAGESLIEGLILVRTQLLQILKEEGLERIPALGLPYDPHHSEAVQTQPVEDPDHHHVVVKELMRGYRLNGRVARPARVVVGDYAAFREEAAAVVAAAQTAAAAESTATAASTAPAEAAASAAPAAADNGAAPPVAPPAPASEDESGPAEAAAPEPPEPKAQADGTTEEPDPVEKRTPS